MAILTKTFAAFNNWNHSIDTTPVEIKHEADAVQEALHRSALYFITYDVQSIDIGGKTLTGEPENVSPRCFVNVDDVYSKDDVVSHYEEEIKNAADEALNIAAEQAAGKNVTRSRIENNDMKGRVFSSLRDTFNQKAADSAFICVERPGEFLSLEAGEKVFDRKGQQIWPKP
jgi:hypothetical protein